MTEKEHPFKTDGFTDKEIELAYNLYLKGSEQQDDVQRAFWFAGHCFYIHPDKGVIEL